MKQLLLDVLDFIVSSHFAALFPEVTTAEPIRPADAADSFTVDMKICHFAPQHPAVFLHMLSPRHVYFNYEQPNKSCMKNS